MKIVCRPGTVRPYPKIEPYTFASLVTLIKSFNLSRHDWILTDAEDHTIYQHWQKLFDEAESARIVAELRQVFKDFDMTIQFRQFTKTELDRARTQLEIEFYEGLLRYANFSIPRAAAQSGKTATALKRLGIFDQYKEIIDGKDKKDHDYAVDSHESYYLGRDS